MDPTDLPVEVNEVIFVLLPVEDILSCCLVSSSWREAVNKNVIWKNFCSPKLMSEIEGKKCLVKPEFEPPTNDAGLSPLCQNRLMYMREIHLKNNFRSNRFVEHTFPKMNHYLDKTEFVGKLMLLNDSCKHVFEVWDVEDTPVLCQSVSYLLKEMCLETFESVGDRLLITQCNLLQLYLVSDNTFTLSMCRLFDKEEKFSENIPADDTIEEWYSKNINLHPCDFSSLNKTIGKYFVGIVEPSQLQNSVIHIWDLDSGKKLKEETIPETNDWISSICCGETSDRLYVALYLDNSRGTARCKIFCYSLKSLTYTQFYVESSHSLPFMLFEEKAVIVPCDQWENSESYLFLDPNTGEKIVEKKFEKPINPKAVDVYGSLLVFGSSNTITVVDILNQEVVNTFTLNCQVREVHMLDENILMVGGVDLQYVIQIWDIKKCQQLYALEERSILFYERSMRRLCLQSMYSVHVLHFW